MYQTLEPIQQTITPIQTVIQKIPYQKLTAITLP